MRRWLEAQHRAAELESFRAGQQRKREFYARVKQTRERLKTIYAAHLSRDVRGGKRSRQICDRHGENRVHALDLSPPCGASPHATDYP